MDNLTEEEISKALSQFRFKVREVLKPLNKYGQFNYVVQVEEEMLNLAWQLHYRLNGLDIPYTISNPRMEHNGV